MKLPAALFVSSEIQAHEVKLPDGSVHTLHFKELPAVEFRKFQLAEQSDDEDVRSSSIAKLIAASLVEPDGKPALTYKQALQLNGMAANAITEVILKVNGFGPKND